MYLSNKTVVYNFLNWDLVNTKYVGTHIAFSSYANFVQWNDLSVWLVSYVLLYLGYVYLQIYVFKSLQKR